MNTLRSFSSVQPRFQRPAGENKQAAAVHILSPPCEKQTSGPCLLPRCCVRKTPPLLNSISLLPLPHSWNIRPSFYIWCIESQLLHIQARGDCSGEANSRRVLRITWTSRQSSGLFLRLSSLLQRHNPLPRVLQLLHGHFPILPPGPLGVSVMNFQNSPVQSSSRSSGWCSGNT